MQLNFLSNKINFVDQKCMTEHVFMKFDKFSRRKSDVKALFNLTKALMLSICDTKRKIIIQITKYLRKCFKNSFACRNMKNK